MGIFLKYVIVASNAILILGGIGLIALGAATLHFEGRLKEVPDIKAFSNSVYIIIVAGCAICLVSALGFWGSLLDRKWAIAVYIIVMLLLTVFLMVGDGMRFFGRMRLGDTLRGVMVSSLQTRYGLTKESVKDVTESEILAYTKFWDEAQSRMQCCGIDDKTQPEGYNFWQTSRWYSEALKKSNGNGKVDAKVTVTQRLPLKVSLAPIDHVIYDHQTNSTNGPGSNGGAGDGATSLAEIGEGHVEEEKPGWYERSVMSPTPKVPDSCCFPDLNVTIKTLCVTLAETGLPYLYNAGCYSKIMEALGQSSYFSSIGLIVLLVMVISIILAVLYLQEL